MGIKQLIFISAIFLVGFNNPKKYFAIEQVKGVFKTTRDIETLSYEFVRSERVDGNIIKNTSFVKVQCRPYKLYLKEIAPQEGLEVLFPHPEDDSKAFISPKGFPWIDLKLDPFGKLMRRGRHHTVYEGGYDYVISIMEHTFYQHQDHINQMLTYDGEEVFDNRICDVVSLTNTDFRIEDHLVMEGESIASIAKKRKLNEYMIYEMNEDLNFMDDISPGQLIKIPSGYAPKMTMTVDRGRQIPLKVTVYDQYGMFEMYEFKNVILNPELAPDEFTLDHENYSFL